MKTPKITIIIPVYNSEKYIGRCIENILNQTFRDFEIIIIDDFSKDSSAKIVKSYAKKDSRIKFIRNPKNLGIGLTRNKAMKLARGKYIMFFDNDDFAENDYIEKMHNEIVDNNYEAVFGGYERISSSGKILQRVRLKPAEWSKYKLTAPWGRIFLKSFLVKNNIDFFPLNFGEDIYFTFKLALFAEKIKIVPEYKYKWFYNEKSLSNTLHKTVDDNIAIRELLEAMILLAKDNNKMNDKYVRYFFYKVVACYIYSINNDKNKVGVRREKNKYFSWLDENFGKNWRKEISVFFPKGESLKIRIAVFLLAHNLSVR